MRKRKKQPEPTAPRGLDLEVATELVQPFVSDDDARKSINRPIGFQWRDGHWLAGTDGHTLCAVRCAVAVPTFDGAAPIATLLERFDAWTLCGEVPPTAAHGLQGAIGQLKSRTRAVLHWSEGNTLASLDAVIPRVDSPKRHLCKPEVPLVKNAVVTWAPALEARVPIAFDARYLLRAMEAFEESAGMWLGPNAEDPLVMVPAHQNLGSYDMIVLTMPTRW